VVTKSLELSIWLGIAALALSSAYLLLWRTRHLLSKSRQDRLLAEARPVLSAPLVPSAKSESASSVPAS